MKLDKSIVILICFYGKFPWYFNYFIHSCKYNRNIEFLIITDNDYYVALPENVHLIKISFNKLKLLISKKIGLTVDISDPYKLCDFKTAYGCIFSDLIEGYDFWGFSDIDVIYGNIRHFMTNDVLEKFDYISVRHDYTTGCFSLFRNNAFMNNIFRQSKDYNYVLSSNQFFSFTECNFCWDQLAEGKSILEIDTQIESFTEVIRRAEDEKVIKAHFDFILVEGTPGRIKFDHGKIIYRNKLEGLLYHLFRLKRIYTPKSVSGNIPDSFSISPTRIYW